jgi:hypothetical protein
MVQTLFFSYLILNAGTGDADGKRFVRVSSFGITSLQIDTDEHLPAKSLRNKETCVRHAFF